MRWFGRDPGTLGGETKNPISGQQSHDILKYLINSHERSAKISAYPSSVDEPTQIELGPVQYATSLALLESTPTVKGFAEVITRMVYNNVVNEGAWVRLWYNRGQCISMRGL